MASQDFRMALQQLGTLDRLLVTAQVVVRRNADGWIRPPAAAQLLQDLRIPHDRRNTARDMKRLVGQGLMLQRSDGQYSMTPVGEHRVRQLMTALPLHDLVPNHNARVGAELGHVMHTPLDPALAPAKWRTAIARLLDRSPFERNVFLMTRFPRDENDSDFLDPVRTAVDAIRTTLADFGLVLHVASDRQIDDELYSNIAGYMWACQYGIALFEDLVGDGINHNLLVEVGSMLVLGRRCALFRDPTVKRWPTDFVGQIYKPVLLTNNDAVSEATRAWVADDLGIPSYMSGQPQHISVPAA